MISLICAWTNSANNGYADDLRRHRVHYDVVVMNDNSWGCILNEPTGALESKVMNG